MCNSVRTKVLPEVLSYFRTTEVLSYFRIIHSYILREGTFESTFVPAS